MIFILLVQCYPNNDCCPQNSAHGSIQIVLVKYVVFTLYISYKNILNHIKSFHLK